MHRVVYNGKRPSNLKVHLFLQHRLADPLVDLWFKAKEVGDSLTNINPCAKRRDEPLPKVATVAINCAVLKVLSSARLPYRFVENKDFRELLNVTLDVGVNKTAAVPSKLKLQIMSRKTARSYMHMGAEMVKEKIAADISFLKSLWDGWPSQAIGRVASITADGWKSPGGAEFLGCFLCFVDPRYQKYRKVLLLFDELKSTTGAAMANLLKDHQLGDFPFTWLTADGASNNSTFGRVLRDIQKERLESNEDVTVHHCCCHVYALVLGDTLRLCKKNEDSNFTPGGLAALGGNWSDFLESSGDCGTQVDTAMADSSLPSLVEVASLLEEDSDGDEMYIDDDLNIDPSPVTSVEADVETITSTIDWLATGSFMKHTVKKCLDTVSARHAMLNQSTKVAYFMKDIQKRQFEKGQNLANDVEFGVKSTSANFEPLKGVHSSVTREWLGLGRQLKRDLELQPAWECLFKENAVETSNLFRSSHKVNTEAYRSHQKKISEMSALKGGLGTVKEELSAFLGLFQKLQTISQKEFFPLAHCYLYERDFLSQITGKGISVLSWEKEGEKLLALTSTFRQFNEFSSEVLDFIVQFVKSFNKRRPTEVVPTEGDESTLHTFVNIALDPHARRYIGLCQGAQDINRQSKRTVETFDQLLQFYENSADEFQQWSQCYEDESDLDEDIKLPSLDSMCLDDFLPRKFAAYRLRLYPTHLIPHVMKALKKRCEEVFAKDEEKGTPSIDEVVVIGEDDDSGGALATQQEDPNMSKIDKIIMKQKKRMMVEDQTSQSVGKRRKITPSTAPSEQSPLDQELYDFFTMDKVELAPYILEANTVEFEEAKSRNGFKFQPSGCPLAFWKKFEKRFPILYRVHLESYSHTSSSVMGESLFSRAQHHQPPTRRGPMHAATLSDELALGEAGDNMPTLEEFVKKVMERLKST